MQFDIDCNERQAPDSRSINRSMSMLSPYKASDSDFSLSTDYVIRTYSYISSVM